MLHIQPPKRPGRVSALAAAILGLALMAVAGTAAAGQSLAALSPPQAVHAPWSEGRTLHGGESGMPEILRQAREGNAVSQFLLAVQLHRGQDVERDPVRAWAWAEIALANGRSPAAHDMRNLIAKDMSQRELHAARDLAASCRQALLRTC